MFEAFTRLGRSCLLVLDYRWLPLTRYKLLRILHLSFLPGFPTCFKLREFKNFPKPTRLLTLPNKQMFTSLPLKFSICNMLWRIGAVCRRNTNKFAVSENIFIQKVFLWNPITDNTVNSELVRAMVYLFFIVHVSINNNMDFIVCLRSPFWHCLHWKARVLIIVGDSYATCCQQIILGNMFPDKKIVYIRFCLPIRLPTSARELRLDY